MNTSALIKTETSTENGSSSLSSKGANSLVRHEMPQVLQTVLNTRLKKSEMIINPLDITLSKNEFIDDSFSFERNIEQIKNDLIRGELDTTANNERNEKYLMTIRSIVSKLPKIPHIHQQKLIIPEFEEISIEKSDSSEIKKFIRKANYEFIGYHCKHSTADKNCDLVFKNTADIYNSPEYKKYVKFMKSLAMNVWRIMYKDKRNKEWKETVYMPTGREVDILIDDIIKLSGNIEKYNAVMNPNCSKCKAAVRKHEYVLKEIQRMRDELKEQEIIDEEFKNTIAEDKYNIDKFMSKNYPTIERIKLCDVQTRYKQEFGINIVQKDLKTRLESTGKYKITNSKNILYITRL